MNQHPSLTALACATACCLGLAAGAASPARAQDWLKPLQNMAEELADELRTPLQARETARPSGPVRPTPPRVERPMVAPVTPPVPLARPDFAGDDKVEAAEEALEEAVPAVMPAEAAEPEGEALPEKRPAEAPVEDEAEPEAVVPGRVYQSACPALLQGLVAGRALPPIAEGQCGTQSPLEITAVLSRGRMVPFAAPVTMDCGMASALPAWVASVDGYASSMLESALAQINTGPGYMCRNRNGAADGFLSEHGRANALDVSGFTLEDGREISVKSGWLPGNLPAGRLLRLAHDAACGSFSTVLGPEANADHDDHLHLDLGCHGASCTAQLCE